MENIKIGLISDDDLFRKVFIYSMITFGSRYTWLETYEKSAVDLILDIRRFKVDERDLGDEKEDSPIRIIKLTFLYEKPEEVEIRLDEGASIILYKLQSMIMNRCYKELDCEEKAKKVFIAGLGQDIHTDDIAFSLGIILRRMYGKKSLYVSIKSINTKSEVLSIDFSSTESDFVKFMYGIKRKAIVNEIPIIENSEIGVIHSPRLNRHANEFDSEMMDFISKKGIQRGYEYVLIDAGDNITADNLRIARSMDVILMVVREELMKEAMMLCRDLQNIRCIILTDKVRNLLSETVGYENQREKDVMENVQMITASFLDKMRKKDLDAKHSTYLLDMARLIGERYERL